MKSNCLLEAVKAKIKNPKNVKIISIDKYISRGGRHFLWIDTEKQTVSHACWKTEKHNRIWYEAKVVTISLKDFQRFLVERAFRVYENDNKKALAYLKKWNIPFLDIAGVTSCPMISREDEIEPFEPTQKDYDILKDFFETDIPVKVLKEDENEKLRITYITFEELLKEPDGVRFKYVTPFDSDFKILKIWKMNKYFRVFDGEKKVEK